MDPKIQVVLELDARKREAQEARVRQEMLEALELAAAYFRANYPVDAPKPCKAKDVYKRLVGVIGKAKGLS